jgi:hypothetical protein
LKNVERSEEGSASNASIGLRRRISNNFQKIWYDEGGNDQDIAKKVPRLKMIVFTNAKFLRQTNTNYCTLQNNGAWTGSESTGRGQSRKNSSDEQRKKRGLREAVLYLTLKSY